MTSRGFEVLENEWIRLKDGTRLAARIWMPEGAAADPVPAILEILPYRKNDGTCARDDSTYPAFAASGYAGVRVDLRGSGESEGVIDGEYTPLELSDACEVIAWIAAQSWCTGVVGMMGISWGGFNSLQVAALKPPALKAVISIASTVDRYNDDIHFKNGAHLSANLSWAATMLAYQSRAPDPALVGERWRTMWLERLENEPFFLEEWLRHQRRDAFWRHGSIAEDFAGFDVPALVIAGWADGYRNTPFKAVEGLGPTAKAIVGPWIHKYPHFAWPKPRMDFHAEAIRWWDRWLKNEPNGAEDLPQMRAYVLDGPRPALRRDADPGRWVALERWRAPDMARFGVGPGGRLRPGDGDPAGGRLRLQSPQDTGIMSGEWFTLKPDAEMAGDQRPDDAGSLVFETEALDAPIELLGCPELALAVVPDAPVSNLVARLVDVHPDGAATRVSYGVLNLAHRDGNAAPAPAVPGEAVELRLRLDACGYRLGAGHRLRLSLSTAYWPTILPSPHAGGLLVEAGSIRLDLPRLGAAETILVPEPENPDPLPRYVERAPGETRRRVERDLQTGTTRYAIFEDTGLTERPGTGLATRQTRNEDWSIRSDDPLSMRGEAHWTTEMRRGDWSVRTVATARIAATATDWLISARVAACDGGEEIFARDWNETIPRDLM